MSLTRVVVPGLLFTGLAFGTYEAIEANASANVQAERLAGCEQRSTQVGSTAIAFCSEESPTSIAPQVAELQTKANDIGEIGWLAGIGAGVSFVVIVGSVIQENRMLEYYVEGVYKQ